MLDFTEGMSLAGARAAAAAVRPRGPPARPADAYPSSRGLRGESVTDMPVVFDHPLNGRRQLRASAHPLRRPDGADRGGARHLEGRHRAGAGARRAGERARDGRGGQPAQGPVHRRALPRAAHAAAADPRLDGGAAPSPQPRRGHRPRAGGDPPQHPPAGAPGRRPARPLAHRPRQVHAALRDARPARPGAHGRGDRSRSRPRSSACASPPPCPRRRCRCGATARACSRSPPTSSPTR